jgi:hypothetical protein
MSQQHIHSAIRISCVPAAPRVIDGSNMLGSRCIQPLHAYVYTPLPLTHTATTSPGSHAITPFLEHYLFLHCCPTSTYLLILCPCRSPSKQRQHVHWCSMSIRVYCQTAPSSRHSSCTCCTYHIASQCSPAGKHACRHSWQCRSSSYS